MHAVADVLACAMRMQSAIKLATAVSFMVSGCEREVGDGAGDWVAAILSSGDAVLGMQLYCP